MIDVQKLKYDLAMQSALAATILNRRADESIPEQMAKELVAAYRQCCLMNLAEIKNEMSVSEQVKFELENALLTDE